MKIKDIVPKALRPYLLRNFHRILLKSLESAAREQGLGVLINKLEGIVTDITEQYSGLKLDTPYLKTKVRNMHAFQISLVCEVLKEFKKLVIVDVGDSSGIHLQYINGLYSPDNKDIKCLSVNLDMRAVNKIKQKGLNAIHARAEDLSKYNINADVFLSFEMIEHLMDPCHFLYQLSSMTNAKYLIITVPYLRRSRAGLHHIRAGRLDNIYAEYAEDVHIFELSPEDWKLIVNFSGWEIMKEKIYLQYPKRNFLHLTKPLWKRYDFEGFYGLILKRNNTWSAKYLDW